MSTAALTGKKEIAEGTMEFSFERPAGFEYAAGQTIDLTLINPSETDTEGSRRTFSLVSAPHEKELRIATRMRDTAFKRSLKDLPEGVEAEVEGPFGSFTLHENVVRPAVFLAGGIGITPFHSMAHDAAARDLPHRMTLFYSNRRPEDAPYLSEFDALAKAHPRFTFVPTMTDTGLSAGAWSGERGYVDAAMLARHLPADAVPVYYLAGPQGMVLALRDMLKASGVSGDDIRYEEFSGY
jgi:ferredoxin-NADP reductase